MTTITGDQVRRMRVAAGLSARELAAELGVHMVTVYTWERRGSRPIPRAAAARVIAWAEKRGVDIPYGHDVCVMIDGAVCRLTSISRNPDGVYIMTYAPIAQGGDSNG